MAAFVYEYKVSGLVKAPAQKVGELMETLADSDAGLTPQALVDASRDVDALLHNDFEWDNDVAGERYRQIQAQTIIRNIRIVVQKGEDDEMRERGFVVTPGRKSAYVTLNEATTKAEYREFLLKQARRDAEQFLAKYRRLEELADVTRAMETFLNPGA